ncbi:NADH-quinone oxidoreductase subunit J family protein [Haloferula rosea]|uniref:NADH-quinone oxidoreductase subunit J n=1 Tax=Haloferula rosea TaxID=490093 RepID=A0A934VFV2_9BACT|nr:NADH-quinone oxidoreductase subunit J [Haloferula rosea]MBK1827431.1 NADH-quinone oxidoreductase subunit J [Haloferula rosea]
MPLTLFWFFAIVMLVGGLAVVSLRNPVAAALAMVSSFVGLAGLFIGLNAYFVGVMQILVYAGAIMVLFLFIIMLLDLKTEEKQAPKVVPLVGGLGIVLAFTIQLFGILGKVPNKESTPIDYQAASEHYAPISKSVSERLADGQLPDVNLVGDVIFKGYNLPLQIVGVLLLVATVGVVVLSKRQTI